MENKSTVELLNELFANNAEIWTFLCNDLLPESRETAVGGMWSNGYAVYCESEDIAKGVAAWLEGYHYRAFVDPDPFYEGCYCVTVV